MTGDYQKVYDFFLKEGFLPLDSKSYPLLRKYNHCSLLQEKSIIMFVVWQWNYYGLYKIIDDCLCSVFFYEGRDIYWTIHRPEENAAHPLQSIVDKLIVFCKKANIPFLQFKFTDEHLLAEYEAVQGYKVETTFFPDNDEYAYKTRDLIDLAGPANYYKRKRIKKFLARQDISIRRMTSKNARLCLEIEDEWCAYQDCSYCGSFTGCEKQAMEAMLEIFDETMHIGLVLYHEEKPSGYIICEKISEKLSFLYFGKSTMDDAFVYLIYIMYRDYLSDVEYMNISEDMGHDGIRKFKKLLSPYELWHKHVVTYDV